MCPHLKMVFSLSVHPREKDGKKLHGGSYGYRKEKGYKIQVIVFSSWHDLWV